MTTPRHRSGLALCRALYDDVVAPRLLDRPHAAALLGPGSEVLGFDTARSTDHDWRARVAILVAEADPEPLQGLPETYGGWPVDVVVAQLGTYLSGWLGFDPLYGIAPFDWLLTPAQSLLSVTAGAVFHDAPGELTKVRERLAWYPRDVWLWLLAGQWQRISQLAPFPGRAAEAGDGLGSRLLTAELVREVMRLCFLVERRYAPYSKWFGSAFARLRSGATLGPLLESAVAGADYPEREDALVAAYRGVGEAFNALRLTVPIDPEPVLFHDRPFRVPPAEAFAAACADAIDPSSELAGAWPLLGGIDQFVDSTELLGHRAGLCRRLGVLYGDAAAGTAAHEEEARR
jgi:hypothetical protein